MIKGAIFDLDGTLISSAHVWSDIDVKFLARRGFEVPGDYARKIACFNLREAAHYTIERFGLAENADDIIAEWHDMAVYEYANNIRLVEGAAKLLHALKAADVKLALATAASPELYAPVLKNNGVYELFDVCVSTEEVCRSKEFPDVYIYAAGRLGLRIDECAVFEDVEGCIRSARSAGFFVYGRLDAQYPQRHEDIRRAADISFESYAEILPLLLGE